MSRNVARGPLTNLSQRLAVTVWAVSLLYQAWADYPVGTPLYRLVLQGAWVWWLCRMTT